jgi:hypothetical protein
VSIISTLAEAKATITWQTSVGLDVPIQKRPPDIGHVTKGGAAFPFAGLQRSLRACDIILGLQRQGVFTPQF